MHKRELIEKIAKKGNLTLKYSEEVTKLVLDVIKETVLNGEEVILFGFGKFYLGKRPERRGTDPRDSSIITIPEGKAFRFKPSVAIKAALKK